MSFWEYFWSTLLAFLAVASLSTVATWLAIYLRRKWVDRAVFVLRQESGSRWVLRNATRRTLFNGGFMLWEADDTTVSPESFRIGGIDTEPGASVVVNDVRPGRWMTIYYIDRVRRSARVAFKEGVEVYRIRPEKLPRKRIHIG